MSEISDRQFILQQEAIDLLENTQILKLLGRLGHVTQTGSSVTGLMVYPDIDFAVQNESPDFNEAIQLTQEVFSELGASALKIADFSNDNGENASYYIGFEVPYKDKTWHIDATVTKPGPIMTNPPELAEWLADMTDEQREIILQLKQELIDAKRYVGARSQPPYTFRSAHLYEGVLKGSATTLTELEAYFK